MKHGHHACFTPQIAHVPGTAELAVQELDRDGQVERLVDRHPDVAHASLLGFPVEAVLSGNDIARTVALFRNRHFVRSEVHHGGALSIAHASVDKVSALARQSSEHSTRAKPSQRGVRLVPMRDSLHRLTSMCAFVVVRRVVKVFPNLLLGGVLLPVLALADAPGVEFKLDYADHAGALRRPISESEWRRACPALVRANPTRRKSAFASTSRKRQTRFSAICG